MQGNDPRARWLEAYPPQAERIKEKADEQPSLPRVHGYDARLDIHGLTLLEAKETILTFLKRCHKEQKQRVLIIHGKGNNSDGVAVLEPLVRQILRGHPWVASSRHAAPTEGGAGATVVEMKGIIVRGK